MNKIIIIIVYIISAIVYANCSPKQTAEQIALDSIMHSNFSVNIIPKKHGYDTMLMGTGSLYNDFDQIISYYSLYEPDELASWTVEDSIYVAKIHLGFPTVVPGVSPHISWHIKMKDEDERSPPIYFVYGIYNKTKDTALLAAYAQSNRAATDTTTYEIRFRYIPAVKVNGKWQLNFDCVIDAWPSHTEWLKTQTINDIICRDIVHDFERHGVKDIVEMPYKKYFDSSACIWHNSIVNNLISEIKAKNK